MTINLQSGNTAIFTVEFISSLGVATTPSSASLTIIWSDASLGVNYTTIELTQSSNGMWSGRWATPVLLLVPSDVHWFIQHSLSPDPAETGELRITGLSSP